MECPNCVAAVVSTQVPIEIHHTCQIPRLRAGHLLRQLPNLLQLPDHLVLDRQLRRQLQNHRLLRL